MGVWAEIYFLSVYVQRTPDFPLQPFSIQIKKALLHVVLAENFFKALKFSLHVFCDGRFLKYVV